MVLSDRSAIDPIVYAVSTAINEDEGRWRMRVLVDMAEFQAALGRYREGTFILFKAVPGWLVDDGVRSMDKQGQVLEVFREVLKELDVPYVEIGEEIRDLQARVAFAKMLVSQVVRRRFILLQNGIIYSKPSPLQG
jgi:nicotinamide riboside kinase